MVEGLTLVCPVRGRLKVTGRSADGLTPSEERFRVEAIKYLVDRGYPKDNFVIEPVIKRFGNAGRNSFRADFAVLDVAAGSVEHSADELLEHALLIAEVKRDNTSAEDAKRYQVKPLLAFASRDSCVAAYWDNIEQRVFWQTTSATGRSVHEGPLANLPSFGERPGAIALTLDSLRSDSDLKGIFDRIENVLHSASIGPSKRFTVMLQLLLAKLHDEHEHVVWPDSPLTIQDYRALSTSAATAQTTFNRLLAKSAKYYERHLPEPVPNKLSLPDDNFLEIMSILAPHRITAIKHSVIQDFYMYFAKHLYKWDLAQYFTPPALTEFIINLLNPRWNEDVHDPACGSADFLTAAFRRGQAYPDYASRIWGTDVSPEAAQVAVLNMVLNGDGKSNIKVENSLENVVENKNKSDIVVCNPPFGVKIVERSQTVIKKYSLGHVMKLDDRDWVSTSTVLRTQETGILFAELCVRLARPGTGRIALVVPNGYLGNRSAKYHQLRWFLLLNTRIAAIVALPRFTFKSSGADVSASVIFVEKREAPLASLSEVEDYDFAVQVIDRVGWNTGDKKSAPTFKRDATDGTYILDDASEMILDSDFDETLRRVRQSDASQYFDWLTEDEHFVAVGEHDQDSWSVSSVTIVADPHQTLDPKRLNKKFRDVVTSIEEVPHFTLRDAVEFLPERTYSNGDVARIEIENDYHYVELSNVEAGTYRSETLRGWQLPARAKHVAEPGDFFVGGLWSSVRKWLIVGENSERTLVTNGMHRLRLRPEYEKYRLDLVAAFCSEAYRVQMRGLARGSDGLAEINAEDVSTVVIPIVESRNVREELQPFVDQLLRGYTTVEAKVAALLLENRLPLPAVQSRANHVMIV